MKHMSPTAPPHKPLRWPDLPGAPAAGCVVGALRHFTDGQATMVSLPAATAEQLISTPLKSLTCNVHYARYAWATGACEAGECDGEALITVPIDNDNGVLRIGAAAFTIASTRTS